MSNLICNGAMCKCSFGVTPCPIQVSSNNKVSGCNMPAATIMDNKLQTFGMCSSPTNPAVIAANGAPQPCQPKILPTTLWTPGSPKVLIGGKPALNSNSKLICAYGVIEVVLTSKEKIQVP